MSLFRILPQPIFTEHQLQARDLLQSPVRWRRDDLDFLRAVITRAALNTREISKLAELRQHGKAVVYG
jgi:hypothetical protein